MNEDKWIEFDGAPAHARDRMSVSMTAIGEITFNRHADAMLGHPEAVVLLYDPTTNRIELRPASPLMPNAFPIRRKGPCGHRVVRAKPFLTRHDLRFDGTVRFIRRW
jgi:hypothetical protein